MSRYLGFLNNSSAVALASQKVAQRTVAFSSVTFSKTFFTHFHLNFYLHFYCCLHALIPSLPRFHQRFPHLQKKATGPLSFLFSPAQKKVLPRSSGLSHVHNTSADLFHLSQAVFWLIPGRPSPVLILPPEIYVLYISSHPVPALPSS